MQGALDALEALLTCPGFQLPMLSAIALDAIQSSAVPIAQAIMAKLYQLSLPLGDAPPAVTLSELKVSRALLLRNAVALHTKGCSGISAGSWDDITTVQALEAVCVWSVMLLIFK